MSRDRLPPFLISFQHVSLKPKRERDEEEEGQEIFGEKRGADQEPDAELHGHSRLQHL